MIVISDPFIPGARNHESYPFYKGINRGSKSSTSDERDNGAQLATGINAMGKPAQAPTCSHSGFSDTNLQMARDAAERNQAHYACNEVSTYCKPDR